MKLHIMSEEAGEAYFIYLKGLSKSKKDLNQVTSSYQSETLCI
jgi:hypothetical protein